MSGSLRYNAAIFEDTKFERSKNEQPGSSYCEFAPYAGGMC